MAGYNEILAGRFNRFVQKLMSMKGAATVNEMGSVVNPSLNLFSGVENRYLESWNRYSISAAPTGGGAQQCAVRLRNNAGSGVIGVIEKLLVQNIAAAAQFLQIGLGTVGGNLTTVLTSVRLDARNAVASSALVPSSDTNSGGAFSPQIGVVQLAQNAFCDVIQFEEQELVLLPGDAVQVTAATAATQIVVWFVYRERALEDSELR